MRVKDVFGMDLENKYSEFLAIGLLHWKETEVFADSIESVKERCLHNLAPELLS